YAQVHREIWIDTVGPVISVVTATGITLAWEGIRVGRLAQHYTPDYIRDQRPETLTEEATILFVDLRGSTPLAESLGPSETQKILSEILSCMAASVTKFGGGVEQSLGDGVLAIYRRASIPEHAAHAVQTVLDLPLSTGPLRERVLRDHDIEL